MPPTAAQRLLDLAFLVTVLVLTLIAVAAHAADPDKALIDRGRAIVSEKCALCHATGLTGASRNPAAPPLRKLAERYPGPALGQAFDMGLLERHPDMPPFRFNPDDLAAVLDYLQSIQEVRGA